MDSFAGVRRPRRYSCVDLGGGRAWSDRRIARFLAKSRNQRGYQSAASSVSENWAVATGFSGDGNKSSST